MTRFICNPIIAALTGFLAGTLSKDHPAWISIAGLVPWVLMLHSSKSCRTLIENLRWGVPILIYLSIAAGCAVLIARRQVVEVSSL